MQVSRLRWLALAAALLVLAFGYASLTKTVTVMADGSVVTIATRALTVGGALREAGIALGAQDEAQPSAWSLVSDGLVVNVQRAARVLLTADGETYSAVTADKDAEALLTRWGLELNEGDRLVVNGESLAEGERLPDSSYLSIQVRRPVEVSLREGEGLVEFQSSAPTLGEALAEQGIELFASDRLEPAAETPLDGSIAATLVRAQPVLIVTKDSEFDIFTTAANVGEALADAGISLQGLDRSQPDEDEPIPPNRRIRVFRVIETVMVEQELIPHQVTWQLDPEAEVGTTSVIQQGQDGVSAARVRIRFEDGAEISQEEEAARVFVEAKDQINGYGGEFVIRTAVVDGVEIEYWATMSMYATSYSPCRSGVEGQCFTGTSLGLPVQHGVVATYLDWYRAYKGGSVYIPGYGAAVVADVGGGFPDGRAWIDLGYSDADWVGWSQWVTVYFTTPVPAAVPYFLQ